MRIALFCSVLASCIGLSACDWGQLRRATKIEGCTSQIVPAGAEVKLAGLKWPINATKNFEIGNATYTPKQLQVLTQRVMQIDQYKMGQCTILDVALRSSPPPTFAQIQPLLTEIAKLNKQILDIAAAVEGGTPPATVVNTAEQAAEQLPETPTPIKTSQNGGDSAMPLPNQISPDIVERLAGIEKSIRKLAIPKAQLEERRIVVHGFAPNAVALTAEMRTKLLSDLAQLRTEGPGDRVVFDVVGYADNSGTYANNVKLGLERARLVAEVVTLHTRPTPNVRFASSAGVAQAGTDGRRVEIFYTAFIPGWIGET